MVHGRGAGFRTRERTSLNDPAHSWWSTPPSFPDASGWLVSTIDDCWSFVSMLLAGGTGPGEHILSPATGALMTTDRLTSSQRAASSLFLGEHGGWGLTGILLTQRQVTSPAPHPVVEDFWAGVNAATTARSAR